jgi:hypothetical protein
MLRLFAQTIHGFIFANEGTFSQWLFAAALMAYECAVLFAQSAL